MNASFTWQRGRCLRSNHIWVWAAEIMAVRLFTAGTAFFYLVPYNHLSVVYGEKKKNVLLLGASVWKTYNSSFTREYVTEVLKNTEDDSFKQKTLNPAWEVLLTSALFICHENHVLTWKQSTTNSKSMSCGWRVVASPFPLKMGPSAQPLILIL